MERMAGKEITPGSCGQSGGVREGENGAGTKIQVQAPDYFRGLFQGTFFVRGVDRVGPGLREHLKHWLIFAKTVL
jgi:hypothetical protein